MKVSDIMTSGVRIVNPTQTIREAAQIMAEIDAGIVPVGENDRLVGMITDRDMAVRALADGHGPETRIGDIMTGEVKYCFEDEDTEDIAGNMGDQQIRRIPVLNRDKRLVGILSLGDIAFQAGASPAGSTVEGISRPGGHYSQTGDARA